MRQEGSRDTIRLKGSLTKLERPPPGRRGIQQTIGVPTRSEGPTRGRRNLNIPKGEGVELKVKEAPSLSEGVPKDCRGRISGKMDLHKA